MLQQKLSQLGNKKLCPIAIFIRNRKILLGLRHYASDKWKTISVWTCPGGRGDENETIEETLRREVAEETGIVDFEIIQYLGEVPGAKEGDIVLLFFCQTSQSPRLMEPEKFSEWQWFSVNELPKNYINNDVEKVIVKFLNELP